MDDLTQLAAAFVAKLHEVCKENKPEVTQFEIEGVSNRIIISALDNYKQNEQLQNSSPEESGSGTQEEPGQVQSPGETGRIEESPQRVRSEQSSLTKSDRKKRRSKKV